jgi:hypothetical protein
MKQLPIKSAFLFLGNFFIYKHGIRIIATGKIESTNVVK